MLNRHEIREAAFQALFAIDKNPDADRDITYAAVLPEDEVIPGYMLQLIDGVSAHTAELDEKISGKLKSGWNLNRISKTDLIILRLGLYEIQYEDDLPDKSAINEAVEIAKTYADEKSAKFINGVLANFIPADEA